MTNTRPQVAALAFAALMTLGIVAGVNGLASTQYATTVDRMAMAHSGQMTVAVQRVVIVGHRANA